MKIKNITTMAASAALLCAPLGSLDAFAANQYGINYDGGSPLGSSNVQVDPTLINGFTQLMPLSGPTVTTSTSSRWTNGYIKEGERCLPVKYVAVSSDNLVDANDKLSVQFANDQYKIVADIKQVTLEGVTDNSKQYAFGVMQGRTTISGSWLLFSDSECTTRPTGNVSVLPRDGQRMFIELNLKVYRQGKSSVFSSKDLYFEISDIDARQSYKILNSDNLLSRNNMFVKDLAGLQPTDSTLKNMFVSDGNYIYSQFDQESGAGIGINDTSNVYVKLTKNTQRNGLNIVFGFAGGAGSAVSFYAQQYHVTYVSDNNGQVSGITEENVFSGDDPAGSQTTPKDEYGFEYWVADVDVTLTDGTTIKAGQPLTPEQVKEVVVESDIEFKAIHAPIKEEEEEKDKEEPPVATPNTGSSTSEMNGVLVPALIAGILPVAIFVYLLPRLTRKKIDFKK